jgi:nitrogen fixation/metabolism regulation signal transduction histidine kinase
LLAVDALPTLRDVERHVDVKRHVIEDERASMLAHDINNPLTYVTVNLELLARRLAGSGGNRVNWDEMRELVAEAREGAERIRRAVRAFHPVICRSPEMAATGAGRRGPGAGPSPTAGPSPVAG